MSLYYKQQVILHTMVVDFEQTVKTNALNYMVTLKDLIQILVVATL